MLLDALAELDSDCEIDCKPLKRLLDETELIDICTPGKRRVQPGEPGNDVSFNETRWRPGIGTLRRGRYPVAGP